MISISGVIFIILLVLMCALTLVLFIFDISLHYIYMEMYKIITNFKEEKEQEENKE